MLFLAFEAEDLWLTPLRMIGGVLCNWLYSIISWVYQLFMTVSRLNILSSDEIGPIYQRVTMILTIVMVFYITFEFVKYVVQPDTMTDKEKGAGNLAIRLIIVIVLIAFVPRIFTLGYELQNKIIGNQVISKVILGKTNSNFDTFGSEFSANMLGLFYGIDEEACASTDCSKEQAIVNNNLATLRTTGELDITSGLGEYSSVTVDGEKKNVPTIKFDGIMAIIIGGFIVFILALYSIDVGTRYAQLLFLQIISPIAIIGYIAPKKDGIFQKWTKQCITTYLDLFIRLAIIYFVLLIIEVLGDSFNSGSLFAGLEGVSGSIRTFSYIVLVLGLLVFANKAPKMLQELLPGGGAASIGYGLKASDRVAPMAARAIGAGAGGLSSMVRKGISGAVNRYKRNQENEGDSRSAAERAEARRKAQQKDRALAAARRRLNAAKRNDNAKTGNAATRKELNEARTAYQKAKTEQVTARNRVAQDNNKRQRSVVGAALGGAITGAATGIKTGSQATKLEDISKKVKEGEKIINDDLARTEKYYDAGGTGYIDRKVTQIQQSMGIQTASQRTAEEIKRLDSQIKAGESRINLQRESKKSVDSAEDRGKSKAQSGELKVSAEAIEIDTGLKNADGTKITVTGRAGQTLGDIALEFSKDAEIKKMQLERAINSGADEATIARLKKASTDADTAAGKVLKNVSRAAFTKYLQERVADGEKDAVMETHVKNAVNNLKRSLQDVETRLAVEAELKAQGKAELWEQLINEKFKEMTFDDIDTIKNVLSNIADDIERELSSEKDLKRTIETSDMYDAQKANTEASGGKK